MDYILGEFSALMDPFMIQFVTIFPYWMIGLTLSAFVTAYAEKAIEKMASRLGGGRHPILFIILACLLGIASPLCMYGTVPLIAMLAKKGIPQGILTGFMISSILLNPSLLIMTMALGIKLVIVRFVLALLGGLIAGLAVAFFLKKRKVFYIEGFEEKEEKLERSKIRQFFHSLRRNFEITAPYFLLGITLTILMQRYLPLDIFTAVLGENSPYAILVSASIGIPLYMCGGGTIPLMQAWLQSGMSVGAACAFMISGPATKLNNLSAVKMILGKLNFLLYLAYSMAFSLISGYAVDLIY